MRSRAPSDNISLIVTRIGPRLDAFERWTPVWHVAFFVMVALATILAITGTNAFSDGVGPAVALVALTIWYGGMVVAARDQRERPLRIAIYLLGAAAASLYLIRADRIFLMVGMMLYNHIFAFLKRRWAVPLGLAFTACLGGALLMLKDTNLAIVVFVAGGAAMVLSTFIGISIEESLRRRELIEELLRAREQLDLAERLAGVRDERRRIARELHDTVTQQLVALLMHLEAGARDPSRAAAALETGVALARDALAESRRLVWADQPHQLEGAPLTRAMADFLERVAHTDGLAVHHDLDEALNALPLGLQALLFRCVQEAVTNARKHSRARSLTITGAVSNDTITIDVHDDGRGIQAPHEPEATGSGFGLRSLKERVGEVGGSLSIESAQNEGTTLAFHIPLPKEGAA